MCISTNTTGTPAESAHDLARQLLALEVAGFEADDPDAYRDERIKIENRLQIEYGVKADLIHAMMVGAAVVEIWDLRRQLAGAKGVAR